MLAMQAPRYAWTSWKDSTRFRDPRGFHITLYASYVMCRKLQYTREKSFVKKAMMHYEERPDILHSLAQLLVYCILYILYIMYCILY